MVESSKIARGTAAKSAAIRATAAGLTAARDRRKAALTAAASKTPMQQTKAGMIKAAKEKVKVEAEKRKVATAEAGLKAKADQKAMVNTIKTKSAEKKAGLAKAATAFTNSKVRPSKTETQTPTLMKKSPVKQTKKQDPKSGKGFIGTVVSGLKAADKWLEGKKGSNSGGSRAASSKQETIKIGGKTLTITGPNAGKMSTTKKAASPAQMKKVTKKTAYDIKQASNQKLTAGARKHYAMNAQAAMKNQKKK